MFAEVCTVVLVYILKLSAMYIRNKKSYEFHLVELDCFGIQLNNSIPSNCHPSPLNYFQLTFDFWKT